MRAKKTALWALMTSVGISAFSQAIAGASYPNLFTLLLGKSEDEVRAKVDSAWQQLFYGDDATERVYYPVGEDMAYVLDVGNNDVRTEGMSYAMMIAVQLDKKPEFDRIWKWVKTYMYQRTGSYQGYFAWHCTKEGRKLNGNPASDGEEWFATSLFFASARWGEGEGIFAYRQEAQAILDTMLHTSDRGPSLVATNMFDAQAKEVVFVPAKNNGDAITDPSYHLPHFYELWALWADKDQAFWKEAAAASRAFWQKAANTSTGLMPDYAEFDGSPTDMGNGGHRDFLYDAWRCGMNLAVDYDWFAADPWQVGQADRLLRFFLGQGPRYGDRYRISGERIGDDHSLGLVAMNAAACLAADIPERKAYVEELWDSSLDKGQWRYYNDMLYVLAFLDLSGNFKAYLPKQGAD
jgi:oligosaccharide reducing-end xylanase